ncbi:hypothetical protein M422DRAFT_249458 [Sphaerobolus stellatus SS14]|uniref:Unplaced genomic scaffold SPHSTscaffold_29, whole genome shotgun sequence n=1 Tax=Sphaerobolus stellatus (strain SS14) TaxID=990650 RepID=A0A0C9VVN7_SPHS4|nr:hypothetical protein M422DRAFT_249458 [Sphaerobolus stellatus SS14]
MVAAIMGTVDSFARGLAVDLAPIRVNSVKTELWNDVPPEELEKLLAYTAKTLPVKHIVDSDEIAEAYIYLPYGVIASDPLRFELCL